MKSLLIENLVVGYGPIRAVKGISFSVRAGEISCLIGSNGAGKTTTLKSICGLLPHQGDVMLSTGDSRLSLSNLDAPARLAKKIALCPEGRGIFPNLTVLENLWLGAYLEKSKSKIEKLVETQFSMFSRLSERSNQIAGTLSGGEQQMLAIARALMSEPEFLLLDEPSLGLAPIIIDQIFEKFLELQTKGLGLLIVEQNAALALEVSKTAYVLETGSITLKGSGTELANDPKVIECYLT